MQILTWHEIVDVGTGSSWDLFGRAVDGPLGGAQLETVISGSHFWFAWSVFQPETRVIFGNRRWRFPGAVSTSLTYRRRGIADNSG